MARRRLPYWLWPCDHYGEMLGWSDWRKLKHWVVECRDEALYAWRWRKPVGLALLVTGSLNAGMGLALLLGR